MPLGGNLESVSEVQLRGEHLLPRLMGGAGCPLHHSKVFVSDLLKFPQKRRGGSLRCGTGMGNDVIIVCTPVLPKVDVRLTVGTIKVSLKLGEEGNDFPLQLSENNDGTL